MADGKNIEIRIAATGGDQAAAEVRKVSDASKEAAQAAATSTATPGNGFEELQAEMAALRERANALRDNTEATEELGEASEEAADQSRGLNENVQRIARVQQAQAVAQLAQAVGQIGGKFREAAAGVAEFDPALAETLRNTGETMEKVSGAANSMAVAFAVGGPLGAGVAGITVLAGELAMAWVNAGVAASEMDAKTSAAMDAMVDRMAGVAAEKAKLELKTWLETLGEEESAINAQNEALDRNRQLLEAAEVAKLKLSSAKAGQEIAAIDADSSLSDEEKIKRKAAVRERVEREKVEAGVNKEGREVTASEQDAAAKKAEADRLAADAAEIAKRKEETDKELKDADIRERARERAKTALPAAQQDLGRADITASIYAGNPLRSQEEKDRAAAEADAARRNVENLQNEATADPKNAINAEKLRKEAAALAAAESKAKAAAEKAAADAEKQRLDAEAKRKEFEINKGSAVDTYQVESGTRKITTDAQAAAAAKREEDRKDAEKKREDDKAKRESERSASSQLAEEKAIGRDAKSLIPKGASDKLRNAIEAAAQGLRDGDQGGEVERLAAMIEKLAAAAAKSKSATAAQKIKIDQLEARIKAL